MSQQLRAALHLCTEQRVRHGAAPVWRFCTAAHWPQIHVRHSKEELAWFIYHFSSLHSSSLRSNSRNRKPGEKQRGKECPTQAPSQGTAPTWGCSQWISFVRQICKEVFLTCTNTLRSLQEAIYPFLEGDSSLPAPVGKSPPAFLSPGVTPECGKSRWGL